MNDRNITTYISNRRVNILLLLLYNTDSDDQNRVIGKRGRSSHLLVVFNRSVSTGLFSGTKVGKERRSTQIHQFMTCDSSFIFATDIEGPS